MSTFKMHGSTNLADMRISRRDIFRRKVRTIDFLSFPRDIRDRIYEHVLDIPKFKEPVNILCKQQGFFRPHAAVPLCLNLLQSCHQVNDELSVSLFSKTFKFDNLDTLLGFLAISRNARRFLRHLDVDLVSGPQGLSTYALNALSELDLHTLTIRCHAIQGSEEDWTKSFKLRLLFKTRGVQKVTLGVIDEDWRSRIGSLSASDPLGHKLVTQLQRPAITPRRDPNRLPLMPPWPRPGVSGCMPESFAVVTQSMTDFQRLQRFQVLDYAMVDPLCKQHTGIPWCICIEHAQEAALNAAPQQLHWSQSDVLPTSLDHEIKENDNCSATPDTASTHGPSPE